MPSDNVASRKAPSPSSPPSSEVARAFSALLRDEFQAPVVGLCAQLDFLGEDAAAAGLTAYAPDLGRMRASAAQLAELVASLLDPDSGPEEQRSSSTVRHELRTPLTAILGYGELMAEEARERGDRAIFLPLADMLEAAGGLLRQTDKLAVVTSAGEGLADPDRVVLPDVLQKAVQVARGLSGHEPAPTSQLLGRVLVVDDNPSVLDLIGRRLVREGHAVSTCTGGAEALKVIAAQPFDLVLLDLMMPGVTGLDVLSRLKGDPATRELPVILISALDEVETAVRCIEAGADDFLAKPLNGTLLRARIANSLERKFLRDREQGALALLQREQERSEALLRNVLPVRIVERLRRGETAVADHFDEVTVLFCDLVGFTALSTQLSTAATLDLLNRIFSGFDQLVAELDLEKIKTIGDAYMAVGGMSDDGPDHARRVAAMAARIPAVLANAAGEHRLSVRIGIDTGPASAGIIGTQKFFYDVWGDTVNTASRLEGLAEPGRILISGATRAALGEVPCEALPPLSIKGKGPVEAYYLLGPV